MPCTLLEHVAVASAGQLHAMVQQQQEPPSYHLLPLVLVAFQSVRFCCALDQTGTVLNTKLHS